MLVRKQMMPAGCSANLLRSRTILAILCLAFALTYVSAKGVLVPIKRRHGGLHSRELLQNATIPLHGAVRDYG